MEGKGKEKKTGSRDSEREEGKGQRVEKGGGWKKQTGRRENSGWVRRLGTQNLRKLKGRTSNPLQ